jgi:hypothetical protein
MKLRPLRYRAPGAVIALVIIVLNVCPRITRLGNTDWLRARPDNRTVPGAALRTALPVTIPKRADDPLKE